MLYDIRPWGPGDRQAVLALNAELQDNERKLRPSLRPGAAMTESYLSTLEGWLAECDGAVLLVAVAEDGPAIGFITCFPREDLTETDPWQVVVQDLVVAGHARRRGVGRALIEAAFAFAADRGITRVALSVRAGNAEAEAAYAALGFRPVATRLERTLSRGPGPGP